MLLLLGLVTPVTADTYQDARAAAFAGDNYTALRLFRIASDQGDSRAAAQIGLIYLGEGVQQSKFEAAKWFELGAQRGDPTAELFLGLMYFKGIRSVSLDQPKAVKLIYLAARQGYAPAQEQLSIMYATGQGVPQNFMEAYLWSILAAAYINDVEDLSPKERAEHQNDSVKLRNMVLPYLTQAQIAEAQRQAAAFRSEKGTDQTPAPPKKPAPTTFSGTAFFVSKEGNALTNAHVVEDCKRITVKGRTARLIATDQKNDLALLATAVTSPKWATLRPTIQLGEDVVAFGFPLSGLLTSEGNVVTGNVTALAGIREDRRHLQISAPIQPGNSGGPLFDRYGNVVGVVVAKLGTLKVASTTGDIPQNVNFAIKASVAAAFLDGHGIKRSDPSQAGETLSTPAIAKLAQELAAQVICIQ
jgi:S1-C subfamily serine protease